jgi:hypothetical protein
VYKLNKSTNAWDQILGSGTGAGTGCTNGMLATSGACTITLYDVYVGKNDVLYFVDSGKVRFIESGVVRTL